MLTSIKRIIRLSWANFTRQAGLSFATCFILVLAISLISSLFILKDLANIAISDLQNKIDISVYFKKYSIEEDILAIKDELLKIPEVKSIEYISEENALENFTKNHAGDSVLMQSITEIGENPLLASLDIKAWQLDQYQKVSDFLAGLQSDDLIEKVDYFQRKPIIDRISSLTQGFKAAGILASIFLSLIAVLITFNTIKLAILNQKEEVSIQRLVGASNWFIRGPFFAQGAISGILSAFVSFLLLALLCWALSPKIAVLFSDLNLFRIFLSNAWIIFAVQITSGIVLGSFSSLIAIRKYLKV